MIRKRLLRTSAWNRSFVKIQLDNCTMPRVQQVFRTASNSGVINFTSPADNGAASEHLPVTLFLTLTIVTNPHAFWDRVYSQNEPVCSLHGEPLACSALISFLFKTILFLPVDTGPPVSSCPAQMGILPPLKTVLGEMEFFSHSLPLCVSCPLLQIVNSF